jgi:carbonic anhydrase
MAPAKYQRPRLLALLAVLALSSLTWGPAFAAEPAKGAMGKPVSAPAASSGAPVSAANYPAPPSAGPPHWDYKGDDGPQNWGSLAPEYALCGTGLQQSPIDIQRVYTGSDPRIQFNYKPSRLRVVNNGHTIQVNYDPGSSIKIDDHTYELLQFHFHTPSEHKLNGQTFDMELHFVHKSAEGTLAVVGVFLQRGAVNEALQDLWEHLPSLAGEERSYQTVMINAADLLPSTATYYLYSGSLTTPPCTEGVRWNVIASPLPISDAQVTTFKRLFPFNARPVQPLNDRFVINVVGPKS